jgi:hypothetical protein
MKPVDAPPLSVYLDRAILEGFPAIGAGEARYFKLDPFTDV